MLNIFVENFSKPDFSYDLTIATISLLVSLLFAFCAWLIKDAYEKWLFETKLLLKIEIYLIRDRATLLLNQEKFTEWISALKDNRAYSYAFQNYRLDNLDFYEVSNLDLLNRLNKLSYSLTGFESDTSNTFNDYRQGLQLFFNQNSVEQEHWIQFNQNLRDQLEVIKGNFNDAVKDTNEALALLRAYKKQKLFSLFRLVKKLSTPFPSLSYDNVEKELKELGK
jgi:hypothetical protein